MTKSAEQWIIDEATRGAHSLNARRLFICFSAHARKSYQYSAVKVKGSEGNTLLARPQNEIVTVDCASLADALVELLNKHLDGENAERKHVTHGMGFATKAKSRCFDTRVVGNIRKPGETYADTSRCVFNMHYFVQSGQDTRMFFDPCMFTTYSTMDEVKDWTFTDGGGPFNRKIKMINGKPDTLLVRVPDGAGAKPVGFTGGWIRFGTRTFSRDELKSLNGKRSAGLSDAKYATKSNSAKTKINTLLQSAGIPQITW